MNVTGGKFKGQKISAPDESITRPTLSKVRMAVFNTPQSMIKFEGNSFLDMFSGSGIMALEAISRGFSEVTAFEKHPKAAAIIQKNFKNFHPSPLLIKADAIKGVQKLDKTFDCIYIDPPYYSGIYEQSLNAVRKYACGIVVLEHVINVDFNGFEVLKQKQYGDKFVTFLKPV